VGVGYPLLLYSYLFPVVHFYNMNDVNLKWKRLNKFKAKHYSVVEDKPYTREQIKTLVDAATPWGWFSEGFVPSVKTDDGKWHCSSLKWRLAST